MKKKISVLLTLLAALFLFAACGGNYGDLFKEYYVVKQVTKIEKLNLDGGVIDEVGGLNVILSKEVDGKTRYAALDITTGTVTGYDYDELVVMDNFLFATKLDADDKPLYGLLNAAGKELLPFTENMIERFSDSIKNDEILVVVDGIVYRVSEKKATKLFDYNANKLITDDIDNIDFLDENYFTVKRDSRNNGVIIYTDYYAYTVGGKLTTSFRVYGDTFDKSGTYGYLGDGYVLVSTATVLDEFATDYDMFYDGDKVKQTLTRINLKNGDRKTMKFDNKMIESIGYAELDGKPYAFLYFMRTDKNKVADFTDIGMWITDKNLKAKYMFDDNYFPGIKLAKDRYLATRMMGAGYYHIVDGKGKVIADIDPAYLANMNAVSAGHGLLAANTEDGALMFDANGKEVSALGEYDMIYIFGPKAVAYKDDDCYLIDKKGATKLGAAEDYEFKSSYYVDVKGEKCYNYNGAEITGEKLPLAAAQLHQSSKKDRNYIIFEDGDDLYRMS